jgi:hypothetical protein
MVWRNGFTMLQGDRLPSAIGTARILFAKRTTMKHEAS